MSTTSHAVRLKLAELETRKRDRIRKIASHVIVVASQRVKTAGADEILGAVTDHVSNNQEAYIGGAVGAVGGAAVGAATGGKGKRIGRAILGSLIGGGAGAGIGHMAKTISDENERVNTFIKARKDKFDEEFNKGSVEQDARIVQSQMPRPSRHLGVMRGSDAELQHNHLRDIRRNKDLVAAEVISRNDMRSQTDEVRRNRNPYPGRARAASPQ